MLTFQSLTDELRQDSPSAMNSPLPAVPGCPACHPPRFSTSPNGVAPHTGLRKLPESPRMAQVRNSDAISSKILVQLTYGLAPTREPTMMQLTSPCPLQSAVHPACGRPQGVQVQALGGHFWRFYSSPHPAKQHVSGLSALW